MTDIKQEKNEQSTIPQIPDKVWNIMLSDKTSNFNSKLAKNYKLNENQIHSIATIEGLVFYKETPLQKFPLLLQEKLGLDSETTQKLASNIYNKLFLPAKAYLGTIPISKPEPKIEEIEEIKEPTKEMPTPKKISPYEKTRELPQIHARPKPTIQTLLPKTKPDTTTLKPHIESYAIKTMKQDIEEAKKQPIPPKSKPETSGNVVDLSGR